MLASFQCQRAKYLSVSGSYMYHPSVFSMIHPVLWFEKLINSMDLRRNNEFLLLINTHTADNEIEGTLLSIGSAGLGMKSSCMFIQQNNFVSFDVKGQCQHEFVLDKGFVTCTLTQQAKFTFYPHTRSGSAYQAILYSYNVLSLFG